MEYAFASTRLKLRSASLPLNRLRALSESATASEIMDVLHRFGLKDTSSSLQDADMVLRGAFKREAEGVLRMVKTSKFLVLFLRKFEILEILDFLTNFNESKMAVKVMRTSDLLSLEHSADLKSIIAQINRRFGFNLNQNMAIGEIEDQILSQYLLKLSLISPTSIKPIIEKERKLIALPHITDFEHFLGEHKGSWFYKVLNVDKNLIDLKMAVYLQHISKIYSVRDPIGPGAIVSYMYYLDLNYKFMKSLYFSVKTRIRLNLRAIWEI